MLSITVLIVLFVFRGKVVETFAPRHHQHHQHVTTNRRSMTRTLLSNSDVYSRGAEIWPPGSEELVKLSDSFPGGIVPEQSVAILQQIGRAPSKKPIRWRRRIHRSVDKILRRAARTQEELNAEDENELKQAAEIYTPWIITVTLLASGCWRPVDILLVSFITGYVSLLTMLAKSVRSDGLTPVLPALPPQGHVPRLVSNPLGYELSHSNAYKYWLNLGMVMGIVGPVLLLSVDYLKVGITDAMAFSLIARPLLLLACQAITESFVVRRITTPLPIRIFVPVAYNTVRLGYLWNWALSSTGQVGGTVGRCLAVANLVYWAFNLFGFLLPTAVLRYLRAHVMAVEAAQVVTQSGLTADWL